MPSLTIDLEKSTPFYEGGDEFRKQYDINHKKIKMSKLKRFLLKLFQKFFPAKEKKVHTQTGKDLRKFFILMCEINTFLSVISLLMIGLPAF